jgi:hypothetical protein
MGGFMDTEGPTFRINPEVLEGVAPLPDLELVEVEVSKHWFILLLETLAENHLEITYKSFSGRADGPLAIAAFVMMAMLFVLAVVNARATESTATPPSSFEQLGTARATLSIEQGAGE